MPVIETHSYSRSSSLMIVIIAYLLCLVLGYASLVGGMFYLSPLWNMLLADIIATLVIYLFSLALGNASMYDAFWSVIPIAICYRWIEKSPEPWHYKNILLMIAVTYWGIRLTINWVRGWVGLSHQDWRYKMLEDKNPKMYWATNLGGIHLFPTIVVYLCMIPVYFLATGAEVVSDTLLLVGFVVCILATTIEWVADEQMKRFKKTAKKEEYIDWGLWKYSRHPNYFGEISFWGGLYLMMLGVAPSMWLAGIGLVAIVCMFLFASIPMMEERTLKARPHYANQIKQVSMLVPFFRRQA